MIILNKDGTPIDRYMQHGTSDPLQRMYQGMDMGRKRLHSLPICPRCEKVGFRAKGWAKDRRMCCPSCGYSGTATHQLSAYVENKLYK